MAGPHTSLTDEASGNAEVRSSRTRCLRLGCLSEEGLRGCGGRHGCSVWVHSRPCGWGVRCCPSPPQHRAGWQELVGAALCPRRGTSPCWQARRAQLPRQPVSSLQERGAGPALHLMLGMLLMLSEDLSSCLQQASTAGGEKYSLRVLSSVFPSAGALSLAEPGLTTAGKLWHCTGEVRALPIPAGHCGTQRKWHSREPGTDPGCHLGGWVCLQNLLVAAVLHPPEESGPFCCANSASTAPVFKFLGRQIPLAHIPNLFLLLSILSACGHCPFC